MPGSNRRLKVDGAVGADLSCTPPIDPHSALCPYPFVNHHYQSPDFSRFGKVLSNLAIHFLNACLFMPFVRSINGKCKTLPYVVLLNSTIMFCLLE